MHSLQHAELRTLSARYEARSPADRVEGTEGDAAEGPHPLPYPNEPVAEAPPPLAPAELRRSREVLVGALVLGESVADALRLAGAGQVLDK